jgi:hypothetical protein
LLFFRMSPSTPKKPFGAVGVLTLLSFAVVI